MAREAWAFEPLARVLEALDPEELPEAERAVRDADLPMTVIGLERFLYEPEALWLLAAFTLHASAPVRLAALEHLRELDGDGWTRPFAALRLHDEAQRVREVARQLCGEG